MIKAKTLLVASAKGGVGKSTTAVNIAKAVKLNSPKLEIGLLDADIYGPSIPILTGLTSTSPPETNEAGKMIPPKSKDALHCMSIGFLLNDASSAVAWRAPMAVKALQRLLLGTAWPTNLDLLVVDTPPGTGDLHITLGQTVKIDGCLVVATPHELARADAIKGVDFFRKMKLPVLGVVDNMSGFECAKCGHVTPFQTKGDDEDFPPILAKIPFDSDLMTSSVPSESSLKHFHALAESILLKLNLNP